MSTTAEVAVTTPTPVASEFKCSRCGMMIEAEGEHLEFVSRNITHAIREGDTSLLVGEKKYYPANRYCIGCSGPIYNTLRGKHLNTEMMVVLMPDTAIAQHFHKIMAGIKLRYNGECGMTIMSLRWIDQKYIWMLLSDPDAGDFRAYRCRLEDGRVEAVGGSEKIIPVTKLLITDAPDQVRAFMMNYVPSQDLPKFEPITVKPPKARVSKTIKSKGLESDEVTFDELFTATAAREARDVRDAERLSSVAAAPRPPQYSGISAPRPWPRPITTPEEAAPIVTAAQPAPQVVTPQEQVIALPAAAAPGSMTTGVSIGMTVGVAPGAIGNTILGVQSQALPVIAPTAAPRDLSQFLRHIDLDEEEIPPWPATRQEQPEA